MPIYEYTCLKCKKEIEQIQKFSDPPLRKCPHCGGKVEKKVSLSSFQLKGTGWYATDYAQKDKEKKGRADTTKSPSKETDGKKKSKSLSTGGNSAE